MAAQLACSFASAHNCRSALACGTTTTVEQGTLSSSFAEMATFRDVFADLWRSYTGLARTCFRPHDSQLARLADIGLFGIITVAAVGMVVYVTLIAGIALSAMSHLPPE